MYYVKGLIWTGLRREEQRERAFEDYEKARDYFELRERELKLKDGLEFWNEDVKVMSVWK